MKGLKDAGVHWRQRFSPFQSMTSTVQAFNTMMGNFLDQLHGLFPEETRIAVVRESFASLASINARKPMELFTASLGPFQNLVMAKDAALFDKPINLPGGLDMSALWAKEGVDQESRDAIWQYLQMLFMLGTTVQSLPPQLLATIENVALSCASQFESGEGGMNLAGLSNILMGGLGNIMGSGSSGLLPELPSNKRCKGNRKNRKH